MAFIFFWKQTKTISNELKEEIRYVRQEMHDMNGRLGRVEGLLKVSDSG